MALQGKVAVVTGGGRGIGAAIARALAEAGAEVIISARTPSQIEGVAAELNGAGHRARALPCDVTDEKSVAELVRAAQDGSGPIDILVNNAGAAHSAPLRRLTLEDWNRLFAVNATGTFLCTRAFVPAMVERSWGRVINIASVAALSGAKYIAAYSAAKHAVLGLTRSVAAEVAGHGVTVNAVCPGYVDTDMTRESLDRITSKTGMTEDQALQAILDHTAQGRLIAPEEVAHFVLALCDEKAKGINGQAIVLSGGGLLA